MKTPNLFASFAAVLFTTASLSAVHYNVDARQTLDTGIDRGRVTNLAPVHVYPDADDMRAAALLPTPGLIVTPMGSMLGHMDGAGMAGGLSLIGSPLAMPYYSFGKKFGRISKE